MKKTAAVSLSLALLVMAFAACGTTGIPKAGSAKAEDMLTLIPKTAQAVFVFDINRGLNVTFIDKALKTGDQAAKYKEFIDKVGVDPQKDVYFAAIGMIQGTDAEGKTVPEGAGVINLKYDKAKIVASIKEEAPDFKEEAYEGVSFFPVPQKEGGKPMYGAFLDESNIALGTESGVKAVIDVLKGKAESARKNPELMTMVKTTNKAALMWSVVTFTPEQVKQMTAATPMLSSLESLKAMTMYVDDKAKGLQVEIKAITSNAGKNKELADMLTGFKAMGAMGVSEKPEIGELLNKIEVSSAADNVKIFVDIPEALMAKLALEAEKQVKSKLEGMKPEEKKDEAPVEIKK
jgi:hypothetical protein